MTSVADDGVIERDGIAEALGRIHLDAIDLLLLDHAIDRQSIPVLNWHQGRERPHSLALVFGDLPGCPACGSDRVRSWTDALAVVRSGLDQRLHHLAAPPGGRP